LDRFDVVIVGGGISGLGAALSLHRGGASVLLLESGPVVGGTLRSEHTPEGYLIEGGPNSLSVPGGELRADLEGLGLGARIVEASGAGARRYVLLNGRPEPIPMGPRAFLTSPLLSPRGKLRLLGEPFIARGNDPEESVGSFARRRLGPEPAERLVDPFVSGIHAGDPSTLSVRAAFPRLWEAEQEGGSLIRGFIKARRRARRNGGPKGTPAVLLSFRGGLAEWPRAVADALGEGRVRTASPVARLRQGGDRRWEVSVEDGAGSFSAAAVVVAVPAPVAAALVEPLDPGAGATLSSVRYAPVSVVHLGYPADEVRHPLDGFGLLCPSAERRRILGSLWLSSIFPERAPEGHVLTTCFIGGAQTPGRAFLGDRELTQLAISEQAEILGAPASASFARVVRWPRAIPQYGPGHLEAMDTLAGMEGRLPGLRLVGNYRGGVSVPMSWASGRRVGTELLDWLRKE